jgi:hypothetical protein
MQNPTSNAPIFTEEQRTVPQLAWVDGFSRLLDTKFRIPGTSIRFGADFILGLIPGAGDLLSLALSGILVATMAKHGASGRLVAKMLFNVALDALVGTIPVLGNIFDLIYKANYRNALLMREYYEVGKHQGSVWPVILAVIIIILVITGIILWGFFSALNWLLDVLLG